MFDALFEGYDFAGHNPVSAVMQAMVTTLHDQALESETERLEGFYESVRMRAAGIDNAEGKQRIIVELYEKFFRVSFKKTAASLGIVYTPIQIVDFILRTANDALQAEFGSTLSDADVHILDPFTGTGTFIVRLLQSGLIRPEDLVRKYSSELHANEIVLLAYYIAAINIEAAYHGICGGPYEPFGGIVLTDTFQITEASDTMDAEIFPQNNDRILRQQASPIRVIVGNPPWSARQANVDDNNANYAYPTLGKAIERTYVARSTATNKNTMYDPYIRAIRWASDRIGDKGIVAYVTNGGWIDGNTHDGTRLSLASEFSNLYVYNLRGNQRQAGEQSREEGGKVFGSGSRATVAILIAVKNPAAAGPCRIFYRDIGDYLTREEKLSIVDNGALATVPWAAITPNEHGDWIGHRDTTFGSYTAIGAKKGGADEPTVFTTYSQGVNSGRDVWAYNFSSAAVAANMAAMIAYYNAQVAQYAKKAQEGSPPDIDDFARNEPTKISWTTNTKTDVVKGITYTFTPTAIRVSAYRPFSKQYVYFDRALLERTYQLRSIYPTPNHPNIGIWVSDRSAAAPFNALMTSDLPNLTLGGAGNPGQYFPRWTYVLDKTSDQLTLDGPTDDEPAYRRVDNHPRRDSGGVSASTGQFRDQG